MTPRENFRRMFAGQGPERMPFDLPMTEPVAQTMEREVGHRDIHRLGADFAYVWGHFPDRSLEWRRAYRALGFQLPASGFVHGDGYAGASASRETLGAAWHLTEMLHPLEPVESVAQLEAMPFDDGSDPAVTAHFAEAISAIHAQGFVATISLECTCFENAWYRRGMDQLFLDLAEENPVSDWLLDFYTGRSARLARAAADAGVDLVRLGDDVGTQRGMMMSIGLWRDVLKPRLARVIAAAKGGPNEPLVQYHSDGDIRLIVDDLIEIGVDILNPVQPECMNLDECMERWHGRVGFSGMIGTQTTMPFGTVTDVREAVERVRAWAERGARVIVAPTHVLEPDVPWQNVATLVEAVRQPLRTEVRP